MVCERKQPHGRGCAKEKVMCAFCVSICERVLPDTHVSGTLTR